MKTPTTLSLLTAVLALLTSATLFGQSNEKAEGMPVLKPFGIENLITEPAATPTAPALLKPPRKIKISDPIGTPTKHYLSIQAGAGRINGSKVVDEELGYDFKEEDGQPGFMLDARYGFGFFAADVGGGITLGGGVSVRYLYFGRNGSSEPIRNLGYMQKQRVHYLGFFDFDFQMGYKRFIFDLACGAGCLFVNERIAVNGEMMNFGRRGSGMDISIGVEWKISNKIALGASYTLMSGEGQDKRAPYNISKADIELSSFMAGVRFYLGSWFRR